MKKTVIFTADLNFYSKGASRLKACQDLGFEVEQLAHTPSGGIDLGFVPRTLPFRIAWKLGVQFDTENVNNKLVSLVSKNKPDLVWIEKGNMIQPLTLKKLRHSSPKSIFISYSDDDMFNPLNRTRAYAKALKYYDIIFVTKSYNADLGELPSLGAKQVIVVDKAYDPEQHFPIQITKDEKNNLGSDVTFIGTYAPERAEVLSYLAKNDVNVRVWGNGWEKFNLRPTKLVLEHRPLVNQPDNLLYSKGISASKINLGFLRKINRDLQTDRSVEIPACGGFLMAERSSEHERLFNDGKEAVFFDNENDLLEKVRYFLDHDEHRRTIADAGRTKCQSADYSHKNRMRFMMRIALNEL